MLKSSIESIFKRSLTDTQFKERLWANPVETIKVEGYSLTEKELVLLKETKKGKTVALGEDLDRERVIQVEGSCHPWPMAYFYPTLFRSPGSR